MPLTCEPTDDLGLSPEFLADEDIARDEDNYGGSRHRCTCGYVAAMNEADYYDHHDYPRHTDFAGCRGCDPVDFEERPYGYGIESWEDAPRMACFRACRVSLAMGWINDATADQWIEAATTIYCPRLALRARRAWERICDAFETHRAAKGRYVLWLARKGRTKSR